MPTIKRYPTYVGIDPGASGGIATLSGERVEVYPMPQTMKDVWAVFSDGWPERWAGGVFAVIEKVSGYVGEAQPGSSAFKFGRSYGSLLMALTAAMIPYEEVTPQKWQKAIGITPRDKGEKCGGCEGKGLVTGDRIGNSRIWEKCPECKGKKRRGAESKVQFKARLKQKAQQLFPTVKVTLSVADALLVAEYCRRKREGKL